MRVRVRTCKRQEKYLRADVYEQGSRTSRARGLCKSEDMNAISARSSAYGAAALLLCFFLLHRWLACCAAVRLYWCTGVLVYWRAAVPLPARTSTLRKQAAYQPAFLGVPAERRGQRSMRAALAATG